MDKGLTFLYDTAAGRRCLRLMTRRQSSELVGKFMSTKASTALIPRFIEKNNIDMSKYQAVEYTSFNDFFARKLASYDIAQTTGLTSPCDSRLSAFPIDENSRFCIKDRDYSIASMIKSRTKRFVGGYCLIFRLCVDDYHRYHFFDDGEIIKTYKISGEYHTVNPIALKRSNIYATNCREVTLMRTKHFGVAVQVEVGAMMVGKIRNLKTTGSFQKGEEKGYFEFGGSTIVLLLQPNKVTIDPQILENTANSIETKIKFGDKIGELI